MQNVQAAYAFEWSIHWEASNIESTSGISAISGLLRSGEEDNKFRYYFDDVAVVPLPYGFYDRLGEGTYRLEWDYATTPCIREDRNSSWTYRSPIASGTSYFSIVDDDSGLDFDIPIDECPSSRDVWSIERKDGCAKENSKGVNTDGDPCAARLKSKDQVACIWEFMSTDKNETETCLSAFKKTDPDWSKYYYPKLESADDPKSDSEDDDSEDDDTEIKVDVGVSHGPALSGLAFAVFGAVVMAL